MISHDLHFGDSIEKCVHKHPNQEENTEGNHICHNLLNQLDKFRKLLTDSEEEHDLLRDQ
jgi:hypothetical protein